jgi:Mrp family chromosome partitioning ATPase
MSTSSRGANDAEVSAAAEAYRILRSSIKFAAGERVIRTVVVVDIDRDDPSGVAEQLALAFSRAGDRCAFVDAGAQTDGQPGLSDLLTGTAQVPTVVRSGAAPLLDVVGAGTAPSADALASEGLTNALHALLDGHAIVIVSCAPLPRHGDALAIAPRVDATILVVTSGKTRRPRAIEARDALQRVGAQLLGVVLVEAKRRLFW